MSDYASLCFLSYERPDFLRDAVRTAAKCAGHPCEVVVHDDGSRSGETWDAVTGLLRDGLVSRVVANPPGRNEGVGAAFNRAASVSTGDPVVKLDQDLVFLDGWLRESVRCLDEDPDVACVGLFRYGHDPVDWRKMNHRPSRAAGFEYVDDFVGSAMVFPRDVLETFGPFPEHSDAFAEDVEFKKGLQAAGLELALPAEDLARNRGFGVGPSTVVIAGPDGRPVVSSIRHETTVFGR